MGEGDEFEMKAHIQSDTVFCPLCKEGLGTIEIDCRTIKNHYPQTIECHCTKCDIWFKIQEVTDEEKSEMFNW